MTECLIIINPFNTIRTSIVFPSQIHFKNVQWIFPHGITDLDTCYYHSRVWITQYMLRSIVELISASFIFIMSSFFSHVRFIWCCYRWLQIVFLLKFLTRRYQWKYIVIYLCTYFMRRLHCKVLVCVCLICTDKSKQNFFCALLMPALFCVHASYILWYKCFSFPLII